MKTITVFLNSFGYAMRLIHKEKLYGYFIPSIIIAILFYVLFSSGSYLGGGVSFMEDWWLIGWLVSSSKTFFVFLSFMVFEFLVLVLLSPISSYFAEKTREDIRGDKLGFSLAVFLRSLRRMLVIITVGFLMQIGLGILLWLLSFILGDRFYEIASMLNLAFFIGFSFFDFGLELDEINSRNSWRYARKNWMACIAIGLVFHLGVYLPQKGGFIMVYAVAIAVLPQVLSIVASKMYYESLPTVKTDLATSTVKLDQQVPH